MFTRINAMGIFGLQTFLVGVEADIDNGMPRFDIVGLPDNAVTESRERVRAAIKNSGFHYPLGRITVNLSPADIKKEGPLYDLPILIAILKATGQFFNDRIDSMAFIGELSLDGTIKHVNGVLPMVILARQQGIKDVYVPAENAAEAAIIGGINIYPLKNVKTLIAHLRGQESLVKLTQADYSPDDLPLIPVPDFSEVKGQYAVKRALEVAAAGGHNALLIGPPGSGKSMLAKRLPSILPDMTFEESLETTKIYSIAGALSMTNSIITTRPFRSPHHSISAVGLSGGGRIPRPGELSLAHHGVLFLDELPEFPRSVTETMRQPIEDGTVTIARAAGTLTYPCDVMLVCAMNPCPCGYYGHPTKQCTCPKGAPAKYLARVSGPLLDRIDIHVEVPQVEFSQLSDDTRGESSAAIKQRVNSARKIQQQRLEGSGISCNGKLTPSLTREFCRIDDDSKRLLELSFERLGLSARAYDKILRVARTIADLAASEDIKFEHLAEAIQYRSLDRKFWNV